MAIELNRRGEEQKIDFTVFPAQGEGSFSVTAKADVGGKSYASAVQTIAYDHIPFQTLLPASKASIVRFDIKKEGQVVGYIRGAGDEIPDALRNIGSEVWEMKDDEVTPSGNSRKNDNPVYT